MPRAPRIAVIGHVEWVTFARSERPPTPGDILHLTAPFSVPAGGGAVTAVVLARHGAETTFYTALGDDAIGVQSARQLRAQGIEVRAVHRPHPQTTALTVVDPNGERSIYVVGPNDHPTLDDPLGWDDLGGMDGVYFTGDDPRTLVAARAARVVVVTARRLPSLIGAGVEVDALVGSSNDPGELIDEAALPVRPRAIVETDGLRGGAWRAADGSSGSWSAVAPSGPVVDTYGAGDSFVAGVTFGLADGGDMDDAVRLGARLGAAAITRRGPFDGPLA